MSLIQVSHLTFGYDGSLDNIFEDVSFQIDTRWKLGLTGRNGRGKTTFLRLLMGEYPYTGTISHSVDFDYFPFGVQQPDRTTQEIAGELAPDMAPWQLSRELSLLELDDEVLYRPFSTLSQGERTKILLAALFLRENHFLLIDEPTNHLDQHARQVVGRYLRGKESFILVSHDRDFLDSCIDHILSINRCNIEVQRGNFSTWQENKRRQDQFETLENQRLQKDIRRLSAAARRTCGWSDQVEASKYGAGVADRGYVGHKSAKMMKRSKVIARRQEAAIEERSGLMRNVDTAESLKLQNLPFPKPVLVEASDLSLFYDGRAVVEQLNFTVERGDRIALHGKNGAGKSSVLKLLLGEMIDHTGRIQLANGLIISYIPQDTAFLRGSLRDFCQEREIDESLCKAILRKLDFSREQFLGNMENFSAGQKKKVLLAGSLCQKAHLYLWDEPLNFVDVLSRIQIEELILDSEPTMVFVEHDSAFETRVATKVVEL
ncbi:ribosomal protection-like ABC-F family protein [Zongyangia hominis]|uniref:ABC-F type ribosomal protection protein n=1 Tax=Zongyangia hominis TaxID=2763677 RepID=A0A926EDR2_9FIRM|nr:ABC-F type ribosomal protection protein [Zongyangia hominis]MBC8571193.1 ABC-F type ribosomal protection protein [Zongyangia hominis]